jgi:hypothetical protein
MQRIRPGEEDLVAGELLLEDRWSPLAFQVEAWL